MSWTTPKTWNAGDLLTATVFNTHIRDNLNALLSESGVTVAFNNVLNAASSSASFVDVDATNAAIAITPKSSRALVFAQCMGIGVGGAGYFDLIFGSTRCGDATYGLFTAGTAWEHVTLIGLVAGMTPGSANTVKLQFKKGSGTSVSAQAAVMILALEV